MFAWTHSKYIDSKSDSSSSDIMDYLEGPQTQNELITIVTRGSIVRSPRKSIDNKDSDNVGGTMSPRILNSPIKLPRGVSPSASPRRMGDEDDQIDQERSNSPKTPQHQPCLTDIGTIVRRVRNVRVGFTPETRVFAYTATETCV